MKIQFYSRPNCHLCEDALEILKLVQQDVAFTIEHINIEQHDDIHEKYALMIPVVMRDQKVLQYGRIDYPTILEMLFE